MSSETVGKIAGDKCLVKRVAFKIFIKYNIYGEKYIYIGIQFVR